MPRELGEPLTPDFLNFVFAIWSGAPQLAKKVFGLRMVLFECIHQPHDTVADACLITGLCGADISGENGRYEDSEVGFFEVFGQEES